MLLVPSPKYIYSWTTFVSSKVNDLPNASRLLDPIMFVDDTNLFFNHKNIKHFFTVVNSELVSIKDWFTANKLSLNLEKTKYSFFHKPSKKDDIPLFPPKLVISRYEIQREESVKFFGVLLQGWDRKYLFDHSQRKLEKVIENQG